METATDPITQVPKLAKACKVSKRTVYNWRKFEDMPGGPDGPWDPDAVKAWADERKRIACARGNPQALPPTAPTALSLTEGAIDDSVDPATLAPDTRYRLARAKREELILLRLRNELVEREKVENMLVARGQDLRRQLTGMGRRLATLVRGKSDRQVQALIDDTVATALDQFVRRAGLLELIEEEPNE